MLLKIRSALLCDLIRTEDTGKQILIGVYTGSVIFKAQPGMLLPSFWIEFIPPSQNASFEVEIKIEAPGLKKPQTATAKGTIEPRKPVVLAFTASPLEITQSGFLKLSMRPKGGRWQNVLIKELEFLDSAPPAS
jgi:hypothetical protein